MVIRGGCHCGNIGFELTWQPDPREIPARACGCSFCVKHGGVWTSNAAGSLRVAVMDQSLVSKYRFGTATADFHICRACGVVPLVTSQISARTYAVVNTNTFDNIDPALLRRVAASFDGEGEDARLARRARNWIADVQFAASDEAERVRAEPNRQQQQEMRK